MSKRITARERIAVFQAGGELESGAIREPHFGTRFANRAALL
jgi:hypothetical protein